MNSDLSTPGTEPVSIVRSLRAPAQAVKKQTAAMGINRRKNGDNTMTKSVTIMDERDQTRRINKGKQILR
jgi:hypothetical protein